MRINEHSIEKSLRFRFSFKPYSLLQSIKDIEPGAQKIFNHDFKIYEGIGKARKWKMSG